MSDANQIADLCRYCAKDFDNDSLVFDALTRGSAAIDQMERILIKARSVLMRAKGGMQGVMDVVPSIEGFEIIDDCTVVIASINNARQLPTPRQQNWCKHDDGDCHADDPCDTCPVYPTSPTPGDNE